MAHAVIVEDEPLYRDLLHSVLSGRPDLEVVGVFGEAPAALDRAPGLRPDVALLDIDLGGAMDGIELGLRLREALPALGVVLLSNHVEPRFLSALPAKS